MKIRLNEIEVKTNLREDFSETALAELKDSMRERGQLQPILVTKSESGYVLVAGERRLRAAKELGWEEIECHVKEYNVTNGDSNDRVTDGILENLRRCSYNSEETSRAMDWLERHWKATGEITTKRNTGRKSASANKAPREPSFAKKASKETGLGESTVKRKVRIGKLASPTVKAALKAKTINEKKAEQLVRLESHEVQDQALMQSEGMDIKDTRAVVDRFIRSPKTEKPHKPRPKKDSAEQLKMNCETQSSTQDLYSAFDKAERLLQEIVDNTLAAHIQDDLPAIHKFLTAFAEKLNASMESLGPRLTKQVFGPVEVEDELH